MVPGNRFVITGKNAILRGSAFCACLLAGACVHPIASLPGAPSLNPFGPDGLSVGEWSGTTSQGMPIAFTVAPDETLTSITLGYDFNDCLGSRSFVELSVPTAPDLVCLPGPCRGTAASYRAFGYADGGPAGGYTQINGLFLPRNQAKGQAIFSDYPDCGSATVEWVASRRPAGRE